MFNLFKRTSVAVIEVEEFALRHQDGCFVIDVRQPHEYVRGHVPGARSVPLTELRARAAELAAKGPVHVICATGHRSKVGARLLHGAGVDAISVRGGTGAWRRSRRPLVTGSKPGRR